MDLDNLSNISDTTDVSRCFDVPSLHHLSFGRLKVLWEAGFPITGISVQKGLDHTDYTMYSLLPNCECMSISEANYILWCQILEQLQDPPAQLLSAFSVQAASVNEFLMDTLYQRSICYLSAYRKYEGVPEKEMQRINTENSNTLQQSLRQTGRLVIKLQGMFREQNEFGDTVDNPDEVSYLVISNKNEDIMSFVDSMFGFGKQYNQNSILIREKDDKNAYYLGCCEVLNPTTFAPGLGNKAKIGALLPYKMLDYCSIPYKYKRDKDGYVYKLDYNDAFAFDTESVKLPKFNSSYWKRLDSNVCTYEHPTFDSPKFYRWKVIKDGVMYGGVENNYNQAKRMVVKVKSGKFVPNKYKIGVV